MLFAPPYRLKHSSYDPCACGIKSKTSRVIKKNILKIFSSLYDWRPLREMSSVLETSLHKASLFFLDE